MSRPVTPDASSPAPPEPGRLTMYSTPWCGYCVRLKRALEREGIDFVEVDIERDPSAADYVMSVNGGNATVPTIVLPDGTDAHQPAAAGRCSRAPRPPEPVGRSRQAACGRILPNRARDPARSVTIGPCCRPISITPRSALP